MIHYPGLISHHNCFIIEFSHNSLPTLLADNLYFGQDVGFIGATHAT